MARDHVHKIKNDQGGVAKAEEQHQADLAQAEAGANDNEPRNVEQILGQNAGYVDGDGSGTKASQRAGRKADHEAAKEAKKQAKQEAKEARKAAGQTDEEIEEADEKAEENQITEDDITNPATEQAENAVDEEDKSE